MHFLPLVDTERVAFRHRVGDINSYENEGSDNALPCVGPAAWKAWRPFTRIGRAKRVGRHALQATGLLTNTVLWQPPATQCFLRSLSGTTQRSSRY